MDGVSEESVHQVTVARTLARVTRAQASFVFGLVGNGNADYVAGLRAEAVKFHSTRHEAGSILAATAAARAEPGAVGVATVTYSPGFLNAVSPLAEAAKARVPIVLVVGAAPTSGPRPWDVDQIGVAEALDVQTFTVDAAQTAAIAEAAFSAARADRRPVVLAIPSDLATTAVPDASPYASSGTREDSSEGLASDQLDHLADVSRLLRAAERPVLLAGGGAWSAGATSDLRTLAEKIGAVTFTSAEAHGLFSGWAGDLGISGGFAAKNRARVAAQADLVVAFGASLNPFTMRFGRMFPEAKLVRIDTAPCPPMLTVDIDVSGDASSVAKALVQMFETGEDRDPWAKTPVAEEVEEFASDGLLDPRALAIRLEALLPPSRRIVVDGGHFVGWPAEYWSAPEPSAFLLTGTRTQSIGGGTGSAIGAVIARPERLTVLAVGDGGALMGLADLPPLVAAAQSLVIVVFNDGAYGAEWHHYAEIGLAFEDIATEGVDFAGLAASLGAAGSTVRNLADLAEFAGWLNDGARGTYLLDCRVSKSVVAPFFEELMEVSP